MISIRSIDYQKGKLAIKWAKSAKVPEDDCFVLVSYEPPLDEFTKALDALKGQIIDELDLPDDWFSEISIHGIASKKKDNFRLIQINAVREVERTGQVMRLVMPDKPEPHSTIGQADPDRALSEETVEAVAELERRAAEFIAGKRAQGQLFAEDE